MIDSTLFNWCVENDFQVYLHPLTDSGKGACKIAVRRRGITTEGKDYKYINDIKVSSSVSLSNKIYRTHADAYKDFNNVYKVLKKKYG